MKLLEILDQHRRDFQGKYQCEFCGHIEIDKSMGSYDDRFYHDNVIPGKTCGKCSKSTLSENGEIDFTSTKYSEGQTV